LTNTTSATHPARATAAETTEPPRTLPRLPQAGAFVAIALTFAALYLAAGAPTPLLVVFQQQWHFPAWVLTVAFAAYAIGLVTSLPVVGSLSDHIGRRPVLIVSLVVGLLSMLMFVFASDIGWVIAARAVQGIATGAATSAFSASVVENAPARYKRLGTIIGSIAPAGGLGIGALFTGIVVQFSAQASVIVFTTLAVIMALGTVAVVFSAETASPRPGALRSLVPDVRVPQQARSEFVAAIPVLTAAWMLAGLFLGLAPTIIHTLFDLHSGLLDGATAFIQPATAAIVGLFLGRFTTRRTIIIGTIGALGGAAVIVAGVVVGVLPLLWIGGFIGGIGFGASFSGSIRAVAPLAERHERAGLFAAIYLVSYLSFGVPAIIAGVLDSSIGLLSTVIIYGVAIIVAAGAGLAAQLRRSRA
jgi:MFS family permease